MKKISIVIPCYNEEDNVVPMAEAVTNLMAESLPQYDYELLFVDNKSQDSTREKLRSVCAENKRIKAIFNAKNFGQFNSPFYGLLQTSGDCTIFMCADFQDPVEMLPLFVAEWERGYKIVSGIKTTSDENKIVYFLRSRYYKFIKRYSNVEQIEHFTGFGLYDKSFIEVLRGLDDPLPFLRGIVAELGFERKDISYRQQKRRAGKTKNNWYSLYDAAMLSITSYTKIGLRMATFAGFILSGMSVLAALAYLVMKLIWWERFPAGNIPILLAVLVLGSVQIFFIGILGEYIMSINNRMMNRPLVVEEERINFEKNIRQSEHDLPEDLFLYISTLSPIPAVELLTSDPQGRILLAWRDDVHFGRGWHLPGGCIRFKETVEERIQRTALDEIGCEVEHDPEPLAVRSLIFKGNRPGLQNQDERAHQICMLFRCRVPMEYTINNGVLEPGEQGYLKWFNRLPEDMLGIYRIYEDVFRTLK